MDPRDVDAVARLATTMNYDRHTGFPSRSPSTPPSPPLFHWFDPHCDSIRGGERRPGSSAVNAHISQQMPFPGSPPDEQGAIVLRPGKFRRRLLQYFADGADAGGVKVAL